MKTRSFLPRMAALLPALLPALGLLAACGKDPDPAPTPDQSQLLFVHAATNVNTVSLSFQVDNAAGTPLTYGQSSPYQVVTAGSRAVQVTAGGQTALSQTVTLAKDQRYSFFATPGATPATVGGLLVPDDLTVPAATDKARIRVVNLSQSVPTAVKLAQVTTTVNGPVVASLVGGVAAGSASAFTDFTPGTYSLSILDAADKVVAEVGGGNGAGTGTGKYEAGRLYTVIVVGSAGSLTPEQRVRVFVMQNK